MGFGGFVDMELKEGEDSEIDQAVREQAIEVSRKLIVILKEETESYRKTYNNNQGEINSSEDFPSSKKRKI